MTTENITDFRAAAIAASDMAQELSERLETASNIKCRVKSNASVCPVCIRKEAHARP
jgi:hypothetical protein